MRVLFWGSAGRPSKQQRLWRERPHRTSQGGPKMPQPTEDFSTSVSSRRKCCSLWDGKWQHHSQDKVGGRGHRNCRLVPSRSNSGGCMRQEQEQSVTISSEAISLSGFLGIPSKPKGVVLFAHGTGSGRLSPRNRFVAQHLQQGAIATLLIDLLMREEEEDRRNVFDIELLADRVLLASAWLRANARTGQLALGYFGASTGAGAALQAAARAPFRIGAIVSRDRKSTRLN